MDIHIASGVQLARIKDNQRPMGGEPSAATAADVIEEAGSGSAGGVVGCPSVIGGPQTAPQSLGIDNGLCNKISVLLLL
jgi:hypothetical protein